MRTKRWVSYWVHWWRPRTLKSKVARRVKDPRVRNRPTVAESKKDAVVAARQRKASGWLIAAIVAVFVSLFAAAAFAQEAVPVQKGQPAPFSGILLDRPTADQCLIAMMEIAPPPDRPNVWLWAGGGVATGIITTLAIWLAVEVSQ